ncbi:MAG: low specificity L-threonine aldolase [Alphaproteobacteria bacterium]|nr:low specificity L-threonine aldolase [Alphaproteobacteria bacterium]
MDFRSDNTAGVLPEIMAALAAANQGTQPSYGADAVTARLRKRLADLFEHGVAVFPVGTGSAANAIGLSALTPPWGAIYCHRLAHIELDETNGPELFTGGAKLRLVDGEDARIDPRALEEALRLAPSGGVHNPQPAAVSITQITELGAAYRPDHLAAITDLARRRGLRVHMDGARFANAIAFLGCSPASITWKVGVDVLSLGATKGGAMGAEAIVVFDTSLATELAFRHKRAAQLYSKMRFVSAQLNAFLTDDLWLKAARHANERAAELGRGLAQVPDVKLVAPVEGNMVFAQLGGRITKGLQDDGIIFYDGEGGAKNAARFVCSFRTTPAEVEALIAATRRHAG